MLFVGQHSLVIGNNITNNMLLALLQVAMVRE